MTCACWLAYSGDSGSGREAGSSRTQERRRHHQRVDVGATAALSTDAQPDLRREEHDHHLPDADRLQRAGGRALYTPATRSTTAVWCHVRLRRHWLADISHHLLTAARIHHHDHDHDDDDDDDDDDDHHHHHHHHHHHQQPITHQRYLSLIPVPVN